MNKELKKALQDLSEQLAEFTTKHHYTNCHIEFLHNSVAWDLSIQIDSLLLYSDLPQKFIEKRLQTIFAGVAELMSAE